MPRIIIALLLVLALALTAAFYGARAETAGFKPPLRGAPEGRTGGASRDIGAGEVTRVALVIGNGSYQYLPRDNSANDAQLMAMTLKSLGFELVGGGAENQS